MKITHGSVHMDQSDLCFHRHVSGENTNVSVVSQARPNQPHRGLLSVSRTGKEGSGDAQKVSVCK